MLHDAGALSKYRNRIKIFKYLSSNPPPWPYWPKGYFDELAIFLATPGVSWEWIIQNFNLSLRRLDSIHKHSQHLKPLGIENAYTATYDDAVFYCQHKPQGGRTPFWAKPFILEDIKNGMTWNKVLDRWNIAEATLADYKKGRIGNVFHNFS